MTPSRLNVSQQSTGNVSWNLFESCVHPERLNGAGRSRSSPIFWIWLVRIKKNAVPGTNVSFRDLKMGHDWQTSRHLFGCDRNSSCRHVWQLRWRRTGKLGRRRRARRAPSASSRMSAVGGGSPGWTLLLCPPHGSPYLESWTQRGGSTRLDWGCISSKTVYHLSVHTHITKCMIQTPYMTAS